MGYSVTVQAAIGVLLTSDMARAVLFDEEGEDRDVVTSDWSDHIIDCTWEKLGLAPPPENPYLKELYASSDFMALTWEERAEKRRDAAQAWLDTPEGAEAFRINQQYLVARGELKLKVASTGDTYAYEPDTVLYYVPTLQSSYESVMELDPAYIRGDAMEEARVAFATFLAMSPLREHITLEDVKPLAWADYG